METQPLLTPGKIGDLEVNNRVVMAAMTRVRCSETAGVVSDLHTEYYSSRAEFALVITEAVPVHHPTS